MRGCFLAGSFLHPTCAAISHSGVAVGFDANSRDVVRVHFEFLFWSQVFSSLDGTCFLSKYVVIRQNIDNELNILLKWGLVSNMKGKLLYFFFVILF